MGWNNKYLDVDIQKKNLLRIEVNQADDVFFHINLYDNGKPLNLVSGEDTLIINFVNANNTITADSNISKNFNKNLLEIYLNKNCTNSYGVAKMQVTINTTKKDVTNRQVTTFPIEIKVNKSIMDGQEVSENVNSMIDDINKATTEGNKVINNIKDTATKYPPSSQLYADVEDLKVREYGGENLLLDSGFLSGNIKSGFPWNVYNSNTTAITVTSDSAYSGKSVKITSTTGEAGIRQYIDYSRDLKSAYTVSLRVYGSIGTIIKISLESAQTISYTIKSKNTWEDVIVTFDTNINKWNKGFVIVSSEATSFYVQDVALWEGRNAFTYKANSNECLYDRIRISGQDVLEITKSGKYAGTDCINSPFNTGVWAYYDIDVHSSTYKKIVAKSYNSSLVYENTMTNGTWSGWVNKSNLSSYTQDSTHRLVSDTEKNKWNMVTGSGALQQNSYCKLPNGLIMQWGTTNLAIESGHSASNTAVFPIEFPNRLLNVQANINRNITTKDKTGCENIFANVIMASGISTDKKQVTIFGRDCIGSGSNWTFEVGWFAIGY